MGIGTFGWLILGTAACSGQVRETVKPSIDPGRLPSPRGSLVSAAQFLDSAIAAGAAPGAVLGVSHRGQWYLYGTGRLGMDDGTIPDSASVYDLASLTKVIGLTTAMMLAVDSGLIDLDAPIQKYVPAFRGRHKESVTVRHLLAHASGLPAWRPLFRETATRAEAMMLADTTPLDTLPGARYVYSDLGAIVLTQAVEQVFQMRLDTLLQQIFSRLDMPHTRFLPPASLLPRIAPTENDPWRGRMLRGEVHDENAARLDGVSGHAGLFSTAPDLLRFAEWLMRSMPGCRGMNPRCRHSGPRDGMMLEDAVMQSFVRRQHMPPCCSSRALGWDTPSEGSSAGTMLDSTSVGHTGFTGTSIWIDPTRELVIVLLTNRVHPTRENNRLGAVRRGVADRVVQGLRDAP
jgi:CubicO group peptidase (beta-lactamase class C family)